MTDAKKSDEDKLKPQQYLDALEQLYLAEMKLEHDQEHAWEQLVRDIAERGVDSPASVLDRWKEIDDRKENLDKPRKSLIECVKALDREKRMKVGELLNKRLEKRFNDLAQMGIEQDWLTAANVAWTKFFHPPKK